jgi:hypothetical protein
MLVYMLVSSLSVQEILVVMVRLVKLLVEGCQRYVAIRRHAGALRLTAHQRPCLAFRAAPGGIHPLTVPKYSCYVDQSNPLLAQGVISLPARLYKEGIWT